jgi:hypothetical protein
MVEHDENVGGGSEERRRLGSGPHTPSMVRAVHSQVRSVAEDRRPAERVRPRVPLTFFLSFILLSSSSQVVDPHNPRFPSLILIFAFLCPLTPARYISRMYYHSH